MTAEVSTHHRRRALVTGASSGIGFELARCLAADGYALLLAARNPSALDAAANQLVAEFRIECETLVCDLGDREGPSRLIEALSKPECDIDVLVNNAGYGLVGPQTTIDGPDQLGMLDLNVRALTELTRAVWPRMIARGDGGLLNVASMAAFAPAPFMAAYAASKAYVRYFTDALWEEARGTAVRVSCLCPGATESQFHARAGTDRVGAGRMPKMTAREVARQGYQGLLNNRRLVVPGFTNKAIAKVLGCVPSGALLRVMRGSFEA